MGWELARSWVIASCVLFGSRPLYAQDWDRWDSRWDSAWDQGYYQAAPPCSLDLRAGHRAQDGQSEWSFLASFRLPLSGCKGSNVRATSANADPAVGEEGDEGDELVPYVAAPPGRAAPSSPPQRLPGLALGRTAASLGAPSPVGGVGEASSASPTPEASSLVGPSAAERAVPPAPSLDPSLVLEVVAHAVVASGIEKMEQALRDQASRARTSGLLPELRLRGAMGLDQSSSLAGAGLYPGETTLRGGSDSAGEIRLTFRLNRLIFDDSEPGLERLKLQLLQARQKLLETAMDLVFAWHRAVVTARDAGATEEERLQAAVSEAELGMRLHVLTGGWFLRRKQLPTVARDSGDTTAAAPREPADSGVPLGGLLPLRPATF
jgi:hypothetical protein